MQVFPYMDMPISKCYHMVYLYSSITIYGHTSILLYIWTYIHSGIVIYRHTYHMLYVLCYHMIDLQYLYPSVTISPFIMNFPKIIGELRALPKAFYLQTWTKYPPGTNSILALYQTDMDKTRATSIMKSICPYLAAKSDQYAANDCTNIDIRSWYFNGTKTVYMIQVLHWHII